MWCDTEYNGFMDYIPPQGSDKYKKSMCNQTVNLVNGLLGIKPLTR